MGLNLETMMAGQVFAFMLVFSRFAGAFMMFPGVGEAFVPPRIRMLFAFSFSLMLFPALGAGLPAMPAAIPDLFLLILKETFIGLFFGTVMRLLMDIVATTGSIIAMESGLSNATMLNPSLATESALPSALLGAIAIVLIFVTGLDHMLFRALLATYKVFPVGAELPVGDIVRSFVGLISRSFSVGIQLATPFIVVALLLYTVLGMMQRMMPQLQLFLIMIPVQILGGFFVFSVVVAAIMAVWLRVYDDTVAAFFFR